MKQPRILFFGDGLIDSALNGRGGRRRRKSIFYEKHFKIKINSILKKINLLLIYILFLIIFLNNSLYSGNLKRTFFIDLALGYKFPSLSFIDEKKIILYDEFMITNENYRVDSGLHFCATIGYGITSNLSLSFSFGVSSNKMVGKYSAKVPSPLYFDNYRDLYWSNNNLQYKEHTSSLNIIYYIFPKSSFSLFLSSGITYYMISFERLDHFILEEIPPYEFVELYESINIVQKPSGLGFNVGIGAEHFLTKYLALCLRGNYYYGKLKFNDDNENVINAGRFKISMSAKLII